LMGNDNFDRWYNESRPSPRSPAIGSPGGDPRFVEIANMVGQLELPGESISGSREDDWRHVLELLHDLEMRPPIET
jgi:hypothetical protein